MIFVLDENLCVKDKKLPDGIINAKDLYNKNRIKIKGVTDDKLLELCNSTYVIVTRDMGLVLKANRQNKNIVFADGISGEHWYLVPNDVTIKSRTKLKKCIVNKIIVEIDNVLGRMV